MTYEELREFVQSKMRLSHICQPLLIKALVDAGGSATIRQLAEIFLSHDESQILYYEKRLKEMPIRVLTKHDVIKKDGDLVSLNLGKLTLEQKAKIKKLCEAKMQEYIASRGLAIWDYRLFNDTVVPDSLRYRVLKEAKGRCALCGITKDERPLDVDHITPRSKGGKTVHENLQVLCSKCKRSKRNKDDADLRDLIEMEYDHHCVFCNTGREEYLLEGDYAYAKLDKYPVTKGHTLFIPKRHFRDYFDITEAEQRDISDLIKIRRKQLVEQDSTIKGFNIGVNSGNVAGQTIFHCHVHLIPRRIGDLEDPRGGVRGVIPSKMKYHNAEETLYVGWRTSILQKTP